MKKFVYTQNNSGGGYDYPEWTGPADLGGVFAAYDWQDKQVDVWVMAESAHEADVLAKKYAGVYFDGVTKGLDCDCCGDRWYEAGVWE
jgi:hypothetical protein